MGDMIRNRMGTLLDNENPFVLEQLERLVNNAYSARTDILRQGAGSRKDISKECDYPDTVNLLVRDYKEMYDRNPIASRVVSVMPEECWQVFPEVYEDEDSTKFTEFEQAFKDLGKIFMGEESWYSDDQVGNPLWEYVCRVDKISGIGHFGLLLIGIDDGKPLSDPVDGFNDPSPEIKTSKPIFINNLRKERKLLYLSVFDESTLQNVVYETNQFTSRYRKPKWYDIDLGDSNDANYIATGREGRTVRVHWSRVIHVADNLDGSDIIGVPRQRPVWNNLLDLRKVYGGGAEGFWKNCVMRLFFESHPQMGGDVVMDAEGLKEQVWDMENGLQKSMALLGMSAKTVAPAVVDPSPHVQVQIEAICIRLGIPMRIFMGSERGQLASGQDDGDWNDLLRGRRNSYLTPRIIVRLIDRLIMMGVLPEPETYKVVWPDPETMKPLEQADLAVKKTEALTKYIGGGGEALVDPLDFLVRFLDIPEDEAIMILERAAESQLEKVEEQAALQEEKVDAGLIADPAIVPAEQGGTAPPTPPQAKFGFPLAKPGDDKPAPAKAAIKPAAPGKKKPVKNEELTDNIFCPTGAGGGIDPKCKPGGSRSSASMRADEHRGASAIVDEMIDPPPPGQHLSPNVLADVNGDGVTDHSRVGVSAMDNLPPPPVPQLPNLTPHERVVESKFRNAYHDDPDGVASDFRSVVHKTTKPGDPPTFGTDDAKILSSAWSGDMSLEDRSQNRATLNLALHQTANAIAKRAMLQEMDSLKPGDEILVTVGGCGAGKGYALKNVPEALAVKGRCKAVWDSAGDQNATENPWMQREAEKRGLKVNYVYVHADPRQRWADPNMGVVKRAQDPNDGRMVGAYVFADSYAIGAKNHAAFHERNKSNSNANFVFLDGSGKPKLMDKMPPEALGIDRIGLAKYAMDVVDKSNAPAHVKRGAKMDARIWGELE